MSPANTLTARCVCGRVELEATGAPITSAVCYCDDCQEGSRRIEALPNAAPVRDPDGGTAYVAYRKDRVRAFKGADLLAAHKLKETSATSRVVATCCNSAMLLSFDDGKWWVDVYRARLGEKAPSVAMRICTKFKTGDPPDDDVPHYSMYPVRLIAKLMAAKIAMLFGR